MARSSTRKFAITVWLTCQNLLLFLKAGMPLKALPGKGFYASCGSSAVAHDSI